jgi:hypothetical protein
MKDLFHLLGFVVALVAVALVAALLQSKWAHDLSLNGWSVQEVLFSRQKKSAELDQTAAQMGQEQTERIGALESLHEGRATLFETAAIFRRLYRNHPDQDLRRHFPEYAHCSEEEVVCRQVIRFMAVFYPQEADRFVPRLEDELRQQIERHGRVILPEGPTGPRYLLKNMEL